MNAHRIDQQPDQPNYADTRWADVQYDLCTSLALPHNAVETSIAEVLSALEAAGYCIVPPSE